MQVEGKSKKPTVISLFSGCGGLDLGFLESNLYEIIAAYDRDKRAIETYNKNNDPKGKVRDLRSEEIDEKTADIIIAGPPCQGFSTASGQIDHDARNDLLMQVARITRTIQPKLVVIENVASLANKRNQGYIKSLAAEFESLGYAISMKCLNAADFGVPQNRKRIFILARKHSIDPDVLEFLPFSNERCTVGMALSGISELSPNHRTKLMPEGSRHRLIAERIGFGQKLCNVRNSPNCIASWEIPNVFGEVNAEEIRVLEAIRTLRRRSRARNFGDADPVRLESLQYLLKLDCAPVLATLRDKGYVRTRDESFDLTNTFNGKYRRLNPRSLSPTVDTRFGDIRLFIHPTETRSLTPREAARLQGFPDTYIFPDEEVTAFRLIGNAVPPPLGLAVANAVRKLVDAKTN